MTSLHVYFPAAAFATLLLTACGAGGEAELLAEEEATSEDIGQQPPGVEAVFEDHYSEGGTLTVYESPEGLTLMVTGQKGVDDPQLTLNENSLSGIFRAVHPEAERVPEVVEQLSARLDDQHANVAPDESDESDRPTAASADVFKSSTFFYSTVCQTFFASQWEWYEPNYCRYGTAGTTGLGLTTSTTVDAGDRVYTLNDGQGTTRTILYFPNGQSTGHASLWVSPGQWGFGTWPGPFQDYFAGARFHDVGPGSLGVTHHDAKYGIH